MAKMKMPPQIKICGLSRQCDLDCAAEAGANFCGFIFHPQSPRHISPAEAAKLNSRGLWRTGVFVDANLAEIIEAAKLARLDFIQLHGGQPPETLKKLDLALGPGKAIKVLWPQKYASIAQLREDAGRFAPYCAWFLLDAGNTGGGSGKCLDWRKMANLALPRPWFLAGGLDENNAAEALLACSPQGLDFNSGLEDAPGIKNPGRMMLALRRALAKVDIMAGTHISETSFEETR